MDSRSTVERTAVRVVLLDARGSVLLLHTRDLSDSNSDSAWELPGGGVETGESFFAAVYREIQEETGLKLDEARVAPPTWQRDVLYTYRGERRLQHESITLVRVPHVAPAIALSSRAAFES
ncbi:MAG: NUDIX domain-containing protein, partial [Sinobacteraceae bacterium]|nr:NUDIX domain-containing protein [Nevskiaceae bacterium]